MPQILVQIGGIELAAVFRGQVHLRPEERAHRGVADVDGALGDRIAPFVGKQAIEPARGRVAGPAQDAARLEVFQDDVGRFVRADFREQPRRTAARRDQFHQRRLVAHADAANPLHHGRRTAFGQCVLNRTMNLAASLGNAA